MRSLLYLLLGCAALVLFQCAVQDNPNDPTGPGYKGWPPEVELAVTDSLGAAVSTDTLRSLCPFTLHFQKGEGTRTAAEIQERALTVTSAATGLDTTLIFSADDFDGAFTFTDSGTYRVILRFTDRNNHSGSDSFFVEATLRAVNRLPVIASLSALPATGRPGDSIRFCAVVSDADGPLVSSGWRFTDTVLVPGDSVWHRFSSAGLFAAVFQATDDSLATVKDTIFITINAYPNLRPVIDNLGFNPATVYVNDTVLFSGAAHDSDGIVATYDWNFGDATTARGPIVRHPYRTAGVYPVILTVVDDSAAWSADTLSLTVRPNPAPRITLFSASRTAISLPATVQFYFAALDSNGPIMNYAFDFGDGVTSGGLPDSVFHTYLVRPTLGHYDVFLTVMDNDSAIARDTLTINVPNQSPVITWASVTPLTAYKGDTLRFTASAYDPDGGAVTSGWVFGDGGSSALDTVSHAYLTANRFNAVFYARDDSLVTVRDTVSVTILARPNKAPVIDSMTRSPATVYVNDTVYFRGGAHDSDGTIASWHWDFGDLQSAASPSVNHRYTSAGSYRVIFRVQDNQSASVSDTLMLNVQNRPNIPPVIDSLAFSPSLIYINDTVVFRGFAHDPDGVSINLWQWNYGDTRSGTGQIAAHPYTLPGTYYPVLTVRDDSLATFSDTLTLTVRPNPKPIIYSFTSSKDTLVFGKVNFYASAQDSNGPIINYRFAFGDLATQSGISPNAVHTYADTGNFTAILRVMDNDSATTADTLFIRIP